MDTDKPKKEESGWTIAALKEYVDQRFAGTDIAVEKAELALEKRLDAVNEFRAQLGDQTRTLVPRAEYEARYRALEDKIDTLQRLVFIGVGVVMALEVVLNFIKH